MAKSLAEDQLEKIKKLPIEKKLEAIKKILVKRVHD
jgi:hypothetical protein